MQLCTTVTFSSSTSLFMESSVPCNPVFEGSTPLSQMFVLILTKVFLGLLPHDECCSYQPGVGYIMVANIQLFTSYQQLSHSHSKLSSSTLRTECNVNTFKVSYSRSKLPYDNSITSTYKMLWKKKV